MKGLRVEDVNIFLHWLSYLGLLNSFLLKCEGYKAFFKCGRVPTVHGETSISFRAMPFYSKENFDTQTARSLHHPYTGSHADRLCLAMGIKILLARSYHLYYKCRFHRSVIPLLWNVVHCKWKAVRIQYSNPLIWNFIHSQTEKEIDCKDYLFPF
jgi:hypothetical protein